MGRLKLTSYLFIGTAFTALFIFLLMFISFSDIGSVGGSLYAVIRSICYAVVYLIPSVLISLVSFLVVRKYKSESRAYKNIYLCVLAISVLVPFVLVYSDYLIYELYGYHFNAFIWNIIVTKGGMEALGTTSTTGVSVFIHISTLVLAIVGALIVAYRFADKKPFEINGKVFRRGVLLFLIILGGEEVLLAYSRHTGNEEIQKSASFIPYPLPTSMTKIFKSFGIEKVTRTDYLPDRAIHYPLRKICLDRKENNPNIIMLTAESFRWDLLDPEITPNLWKLSEKSLNFTNHYSGGNRTRMGMFSLFYGLYAPYWFPFEKGKIGPVLMDVVKKLDYQIELNTSQSFNYPELRRTTFAGIGEEHMHELHDGPSWKRDVDNISMIIDSIKNRDQGRPFFNFMFFESTHAPYNFPKDAVIRPDYEEEVDYLNIVNLGDKIFRLHNRYINAAHHIDKEVGRLLEYLEENGLMEKTIILFTGDHGEEFMEKGRWGHGHNARFTKYQTKVPFILKVPGEKPGLITYETNHLQFPAFLLQRLGVTNDFRDYSLAPALMEKKPGYFVIGNYNYITLQDEKYKITFPFTGQDYFHYNVYHKNDDNFVLKKEVKQIIKASEVNLNNVYFELQRFYENSKDPFANSMAVD